MARTTAPPVPRSRRSITWRRSGSRTGASATRGRGSSGRSPHQSLRRGPGAHARVRGGTALLVGLTALAGGVVGVCFWLGMPFARLALCFVPIVSLMSPSPRWGRRPRSPESSPSPSPSPSTATRATSSSSRRRCLARRSSSVAPLRQQHRGAVGIDPRHLRADHLPPGARGAGVLHRRPAAGESHGEPARRAQGAGHRRHRARRGEHGGLGGLDRLRRLLQLLLHARRVRPRPTRGTAPQSQTPTPPRGVRGGAQMRNPPVSPANGPGAPTQPHTRVRSDGTDAVGVHRSPARPGPRGFCCSAGRRAGRGAPAFTRSLCPRHPFPAKMLRP